MACAFEKNHPYGRRRALSSANFCPGSLSGCRRCCDVCKKPISLPLLLHSYLSLTQYQAVCLERAAGDVPLALQVAERIRYNRSHTIHQSSISNRDSYHNWTWTPELAAKHPGALTIPRPDWIVEFDARQVAEEHFDQLASDVRSGKQGTIEQLSLPSGGTFEIFHGDAEIEGADKGAPEQTARL